MKKALVAFAVFSLGGALLVSGCKKDSTKPLDGFINISGTWAGTYVDGVNKGTLTFVLGQNEATITGTWSAVDTAGHTGNGAVSGNVYSAGNVALRMTGTVGNCTTVNILASKVSGVAVGDSLTGTYTGTNTCGGSWAGTQRLIKQ